MSEGGPLPASVDADRLAALAEFVAEYEAEHGEITDDEMEAAARWARGRAVVVPSPPESA